MPARQERAPQGGSEVIVPGLFGPNKLKVAGPEMGTVTILHNFEKGFGFVARAEVRVDGKIKSTWQNSGNPEKALNALNATDLFTELGVVAGRLVPPGVDSKDMNVFSDEELARLFGDDPKRSVKFPVFRLPQSSE